MSRVLLSINLRLTNKRLNFVSDVLLSFLQQIFALNLHLHDLVIRSRGLHPENQPKLT